MPGWSMTKTVLNALVGILVKDGKLTLDAPAPVAAWSAPGDPRARITVNHLLRMSSGLRFDENMENPRADIYQLMFRVPDMAAYAAGKPLDAEPGTRWQYSTGTSMILSGALRSIIGVEEYGRFPRVALFDRVGMTSAVLETDAAGTFVASSFMYATARDWARFGLLYLGDGIWNGDRILPEEWVAYSRTPAPADAERAYGAHIWLKVPEEYHGSNATLPDDAFHAAGHEAQFVTVVPSRDLVIVRLGKTRYPQAWDHTRFVRDVVDALDRTPAG
jgi:CubicO group peptidase (beta-lactamase class C family)